MSTDAHAQWLGLALLVAAATACDPKSTGLGPARGDGATPDDPRPELLAKLEAGEARWALAVSECPSYFYVRDHLSAFGVYSATMVAVENQAPVLRRRWQGSATGWTVAWTEGSTEIGSHPDKGSFYMPDFPPSTVSELHAECRQILQRDPETTAFALELDDRGVPLRCSWTWKGCLDDCYGGIFMHSFACGAITPCDPSACDTPAGTTATSTPTCRPGACCVPLPRKPLSCGDGSDLTCVQGVCQLVTSP